ncbi:MAG: cache domain-containing protein, partial [Lachnospiraceae bacterium]|nr:cache domain-containing protein [Lachnospiraceae bacterium]
MSQNEKDYKRRREYEDLHKTVIVNEGLKPIKVIAPIILICVIIAIMSLYSYIQKKNIIEDAEQVTNQMAEYIAGSIDNEMDYARSSIKFAANAISRTMTSESLEAPAEIITPMVVNTPFGGVEYIRPDGMNVMNIGEPFDASDRVYYIEGIKGNTGIWNNFHPKTSKETLMNFYTPLVYEGKIAGVLTGYIAATSQISPLFEKKLYGQDIYGFLVDENDMVICSTIESEYVKDLSLEVFMDNLGVDKDKKQRLRETINNAKDEAASYKDEKGEERVCVVKVPDTEWKVVILVPEASFKAIISNNTRNSVITIIAIALLLISYGSAVLLKNVKRRKEIARENAKLEEENRIFNEENKRAFLEISAIRDIIASAEMGTWRIELVDGKEPRMFVDDTMKALLGILGQDITAEETYRVWFDNITAQAVDSVIESVNKMKEGSFDENTYLWRHPVKGERYVRCGGTAQKTGYGYLISGYHYDVDDVVREDQAKVVMLKNALNEKNDYYNTLGTLADIYNSLQVIDLVADSIIDFNNDDKFKDLISPEQGANKIISGIMSITATDECKDRALEFLDLSTLAERMKNKKYISTQLISKRIGWFLATFITMETDESKRPKRVILTTQSIDEAKKQEELLIHRSRTDELT